MKLFLIDRHKRNITEDFGAYRDFPDMIRKVIPDTRPRIEDFNNYDHLDRSIPSFERTDYVVTYTLRNMGFRDSQSNISNYHTFYAEDILSDHEAFNLYCHRQGEDVARNRGEIIHCPYDRYRHSEEYHAWVEGYYEGKHSKDVINSKLERCYGNNHQVNKSIKKEKIFTQSLINDDGTFKKEPITS